MAQILQFKHDTQIARAVAQQSAVQCEVIIFPGVRYARWDDAATQTLDEQLAQIEAEHDEENVQPQRRTKRTKSAAKRRDVLVLPD